MIKRINLVKIHLYFSGVTLLFLAMMALSGSLHLLTGDETEEISELKVFQVTDILTKEDLTNIFARELKKIDSNFDYDYIKGSASSLITRPTTRTYYSIKLNDKSATISRHVPSLNKRIMELHKGHGARSTRNVLGILGIFVIGAVVSGLWLGLSSNAFRKVTFATMISGACVYLILFFL